jgi:hypothetical protein
VKQLEDRALPSGFTAANISDLIADINAANNAGGTNTITLTAPSTSPYVLTAVNNTTDGATGLPVISGGGKKVAADNLTVIGNGDTIERNTDSGTPAFRLFDVAGGGSLTLENLTLQNGLAFGSGSAAEGGAIYSQGSLVLSGATIQDNDAVGARGAAATRPGHVGGSGQDAAGGGVWSNGSLTLENATQILSNRAGGGNGGLGLLKPSTCRNFANGGNGYGGGVYVAGGTVSFTNSTLSGNSAVGGVAGWEYSSPGGPTTYGEGNGGSGFGGGLYVARGTVNVTGVLVSNNTAQGGYLWTGFHYSTDWCVPTTRPPQPNGYGGGICVAGGTVTLSSDTVESNAALGGYGAFVAPGLLGYGFGFGGGIYIASGATATLCSDTVQSNSASGPTSSSGSDGGGIYIVSGATVYLDPFTVTNAITNADGSGTNGSTANIDGPYTLQNC